MQDVLQTLIEKHCGTLKDYVSQIDTSLARLENETDDHLETLSQALELTHKMCGASGSIGFSEVSLAAARLEEVLNVSIEATHCEDEFERNHIFRQFGELKTLIATLVPEQSTLYGFDLASIVPPAAAKN